MATVNKDFRVKHGLVVEGTNATVDGSDIITEDAIVGGTQTNVVVTYDAVNKVVNFAAESGLADGDTDDLAEGTTNLYYTEARAKTDAAELLTGATLTNITITGDGDGLTITAENGVADSDTDDLVEGTTNLYFTDARARGALSAEYGVGYNSSTGVFSATVKGDGGIAADPDGLNIKRSVVDTWYDAAGSAATSETNANDYTDDAIALLPGNGLSISSGVLSVNVQNGIQLNGDNLELKNSYVADVAKNSVSAGDGLDYNPTSGEFSADLGNGLQIDGTGQIEIDNNVVATQTDLSDDIGTHSGLTTGVHGVTGDVVGTTDAQTLTNKTLGADTSLSEDLDASENKIVNLATPTDAFDAATKAYVDAKAEGLSVKPAVMAATTANLASTYDNGTLGVGSTLTSTSNGAFPLIDGVQLSTLSGQRGLLVKNQTDATQNGRYNLTTLGDENTPWVLTRCGLCDEVTEIPSAYVFVQGGDLYEATGWAAFVENPTTFVVGDDDISWFQFAGAGTYLAGNGLNLDGNTFSIDDTVTATKDYVDTNFVNVADLPGELDDYVLITQKGEADGVATLDEDGQVPVTQLAHVTEAIDALDTDDIEEGTTNLYFTDSRARDALESTDTNFLSVGLGFDNFASGGPVTLGKQFAATVNATKTNNYLYGWNLDVFSSAKFLIKTAYGTHTEISEYLVTSDTSYNLAVTEYAVVGTNGSLSTLSFSTASGGGSVNLTATVENFPATITIVGTLIA